jgi:hypothetical protein
MQPKSHRSAGVQLIIRIKVSNVIKMLANPSIQADANMQLRICSIASSCSLVDRCKGRTLINKKIVTSKISFGCIVLLCYVLCMPGCIMNTSRPWVDLG